MLKKLIAILFPPDVHTWTYTDKHGTEFRTCTVCGQHEELDPGCGMCSSAWMVEISGDKNKHLAPVGA